MYFKQIEMAGFKSFADRIDIKFDNGITAIVGPNGCGKSNVADAIRWVLGEQSSKLLRGTSMQDVIFSGTEKRKSLSYCEVTLTFDNNDRFFNFDYDELAITRKLFRSGESEYMLNRTPCRLKDIVNLLYDSGIGRDGYSIIGQGKVQEIIDSKPEARRYIFEDAAGIAKFKSRKVEAERKLERTRDNLVRLKDIISEIERQLGPLKKQAENAKKFLELKGNLKDLEVNAYVYQYENASELKAKINLRLGAIIEELDLRQTDFDKVNSDYDKAMLDVENFDKVLNSLHEKILELTVGLEKQAGETKVIRERINYINQENDRLNLNVSNSKELLTVYGEELYKKEELLKECVSKLEILNQSYEEISNSYLKIVDELNLSEDQQGKEQKEIIDRLGSLSDIKSTKAGLIAEKELTKSRCQSLNEKAAELKEKVESLKESKNTLLESLKALEESCNEYKTKQEKLSTETFLLDKKLKDENEEKHNLATSIQVFENRKRLLSEMQAEFEGYASSVKKILRESERNVNIKNKIVGVLANLIKVPQEYETAIEVALGNAVQNIVTYDESGAKSLISFLKENSFGRATFLPITSMKRRSIDASMQAQLKISGVYGIASSLISYDKNIDSVISNLLGATVIVNNLDTAVTLAKSTRFSFKIVTLDGDIINPQGSMTGGSRKSEAVNLISRGREIETLAKEIENKKSRLFEINLSLETENNKLSILKSELENITTKRSKLEIDYATEREKFEALSSGLKDEETELESLRKEIETLNNKLILIDNELESKSKLENAINGNQEDVDAILYERKQNYEKLRRERDELNSNLTSVKVELTSKEAEKNMLENEIIRIKTEISKQESMLHDFDSSIVKNNKLIADAENMIKLSIDNAPVSQTKIELTELKNKKDQIEESKKTLQDSIRVLNDKKSKLMDEISVLNDRKYKEEMNLTKVDTDIESMQERIFEEYELTYAGCLEFRRPDFDISVAMPEINHIKRQISALGYVNVNAIEDSKVLLERYDDLSSQAEDLTKAEEDLTKIIKELSEEMIQRFNSEFVKINENFKITFKELFGGGNARLELTESDNPLEAGVDIVAEPPGKKLQNITLLSGGEKALTAIAILFAILRLKPLPFCLLDEIEAALDDANVERFAQYLRRFSNETQFIVITHRKPTMELADSLYGVTMEEKGVSKMVSVKLSEAVKIDNAEN